MTSFHFFHETGTLAAELCVYHEHDLDKPAQSAPNVGALVIEARAPTVIPMADRPFHTSA